MAKLNGVKTLDMVNGEITKVEYGGAVYEKVDEVKEPLDGDIAQHIKGSSSYTKGAFYELKGGLSMWGSFKTVSDDYDSTTNGMAPKFWCVFRKVAPTSEYILVTDREPKAGDFVKFSEEYADDDTDLTAGKYYKITKVEDGTCVVFFDDDFDKRFKRSDVSGVEVYELVAEAKRQAEEKAETARWAKIGRKPNEFKQGDIVRLNRDSGANDEGEIVEIATDGAHSYFDESGDRYAGAPHWFELITPVEQRFDLTEGADD